MPWIYGAAQVGEEYQYAMNNNLSTLDTSINIGTRVAGTTAEVAIGAKYVAATTATGAALGSFVPVVGTAIGGAAGAAIGLVSYTFTDWFGAEQSLGTSINNAITNSSRAVIGWFQ